MKTRMPAVECNYYENKLAADRLYNNDEWISTGHAAGLRSKHREECTGETAQRRHGKDGLQQTVSPIGLPAIATLLLNLLDHLIGFFEGLVC